MNIPILTDLQARYQVYVETPIYMLKDGDYLKLKEDPNNKLGIRTRHFNIHEFSMKCSSDENFYNYWWNQ